MSKKSEILIFLAHANEDKEAVSKLYDRLKRVGYKPWLDKEDLIPGQNWRLVIPEVIAKSQLFVACLSSRSIAKQGFVQREFRMALTYAADRPPDSIYIIPIRLDNCEIPNLRQEEYGINLRNYHWLDYWEDDGFYKLERAIEYQYGPFEEEIKPKLSTSISPSEATPLPEPKQEVKPPTQSLTSQAIASSLEPKFEKVKLRSERGVDYNKLRDFLKQFLMALKKGFVEKKKEEATELLVHANKAAKGENLDVTNALQRAATSPQEVQVVEPVILLPQPKPEPKNSPGDKEIELKSAKGVDYTKLRELLKQQKWYSADEETAQVMLLAAGREKEDWLDVDSIFYFPSEDLRTINQLWLHYSNGKFGFSVQKEIYEELGGTREYNGDVWKNLCERVGWKDGENWMDNNELTFNLNAPTAHFPSSWRGRWYNIMERIILPNGRTATVGYKNRESGYRGGKWREVNKEEVGECRICLFSRLDF